MRGLKIPVLVALAGVAVLWLGHFIGSRPHSVFASADRSAPRTERPVVSEPIREIRRTEKKEGIPKASLTVTRRPGSLEDIRSRARRISPGSPSRIRADRAPLLFLFTRELDLTAEQRRHFEEALREQDEAVKRLEEEIERTGVFDRSDCSARVDEIRAVTYEKMSRCLENLQYRRYNEILAGGRLGDAVILKMPRGVEIRE